MISEEQSAHSMYLQMLAPTHPHYVFNVQLNVSPLRKCTAQPRQGRLATKAFFYFTQTS
jgi:hypothetical protein